MKIRMILHTGAWLFTGALFLFCSGMAFYVLMASGEPVKPPPPTERRFLTAQEVIPGARPDVSRPPVATPTIPKVDTSRLENRLGKHGIQFQKDNIRPPRFNPPNLTPGGANPDGVPVYGSQASNPVPYDGVDGQFDDGASPEELNSRRAEQRADRERRRLDSLNERILKLEERLHTVRNEAGGDDQADRLQRSLERLHKRRDDLKRELTNKQISVD